MISMFVQIVLVSLLVLIKVMSEHLLLINCIKKRNSGIGIRDGVFWHTELLDPVRPLLIILVRVIHILSSIMRLGVIIGERLIMLRSES